MTNTTKTSRQEMIDVIYEKIARKDLEFGCRILFKDQELDYESTTPDAYWDGDTIQAEIPCDIKTIYMWKGDFRIIDIIIHDKPYNDGYNNLTYSEIFDFTDFSEDDISCYEDSLYSTNIEGYKHAEIIGHPVMIGDVMDYFENIALDKIYDYIWVKKEEIPDLILQKTKDARMKIFPLWKQKRKPIEEQSDDCIDFIYNLILCTKNIKN